MLINMTDPFNQGSKLLYINLMTSPYNWNPLIMTFPVKRAVTVFKTNNFTSHKASF